MYKTQAWEWENFLARIAYGTYTATFSYPIISRKMAEAMVEKGYFEKIEEYEGELGVIANYKLTQAGRDWVYAGNFVDADTIALDKEYLAKQPAAEATDAKPAQSEIERTSNLTPIDESLLDTIIRLHNEYGKCDLGNADTDTRRALQRLENAGLITCWSWSALEGEDVTQSHKHYRATMRAIAGAHIHYVGKGA